MLCTGLQKVSEGAEGWISGDPGRDLGSVLGWEGGGDAWFGVVTVPRPPAQAGTARVQHLQEPCTATG